MQKLGKSPHSGVISEIQRVKFGIIVIYIFWKQNLGFQQEFQRQIWKYPLGIFSKWLCQPYQQKLFNNSIFNPNGNVAQDQDDGDDDDKMPSQGQIVDLPAMHSQMTDAEIKKIFKKKRKPARDVCH